jgi:5-methylcytosine-specific restriction endonuclease McrA
MKFRLIQSNNRGLITSAGDRTYARSGPAKGEEDWELPTLFIWSSKPSRLVARCWTRWTGEKLERDFIYEVTSFRDVIDLQGDTRYHQWCSQQLRLRMWEMTEPVADVSQECCPEPESVHEHDRHKAARYLERRKTRLRAQTPVLTEEEQMLIASIYQRRDSLNQAAGYIAYHVDHIKPLARGGLHHPSNLRLTTSHENMSKGAKELEMPKPDHPVIAG